METIRFEHKDCLELLRELPDGCIDLMLQDPPYGVTQNEWDKEPFLPLMWAEWERVLKPNGAWIFTAQQPFVSSLISSRAGFFRYDLIWYKPLGTGFLNANRMPMRNHEHILVFYRQLPTYNPQMSIGRKRVKGSSKNKERETNTNYGGFMDLQKRTYEETYPQSVVEISNADRTNECDHPTQKPVDLMRYLIKTYSNEGDTVFDGYAGSGTTAIACIKEKRKFIGCELNAEYYSKAADRIKEERSKLVLF